MDGFRRRPSLPSHADDPEGPNGKRILSELFEWKSARLAVLPAQLIKGVTLGASMPSAFRGHLTELCERRTPAIPVWESVCDDAEYAVRFSPVLT